MSGTAPPAFRPSAAASRVGVVAAAAAALLGLCYAVTLAAGLATVGLSDRPIGEPYFSLLELLILALAPVMVALIAAIHAGATPERKLNGMLALTFMTCLAVLTCGLHFLILTLSHRPEFEGTPWSSVFSFRWPSLAYALDILAWDGFFALSVLCAAPVFGSTPLERAVRRLLILSGLLALTGFGAVALDDMRWRMIGIFGYAVLFPIAAGLMARVFARTRPAA